MTHSGTSTARYARVVCGVILGAFGAWLFAATQRTWPDVLIDFGRELYAPWRLSQGDTLYRDLAWFNGPLSPYLNALFFKAFGASLNTLVALNALLCVLALVLIWRLLEAIAGRWAAFLGCAMFLGCFGIAQQVGIGNYNWLTPYSHEATHGMLLALASVEAVRMYLERGRKVWLALAGVCVGLAFLTKAEMFVAASLGALTALACPVQGRAGTSLRERAREALLFGAAAVVPPALAFVLLTLELGPGPALHGVLGSWPHVVSGSASDLAFYRSGMGLDAPAMRLGEMLRWSAAWLIALAVPAALASWVRGAFWQRLTAAVWALAVLAILWFWPQKVIWSGAARPLPLLALGVLIASLAASLTRIRSANTGGEPRADAATAVTAVTAGLAALALAALAKMILFARVLHYGFVLALPATLLLAALFAGWAPRWLQRRGKSALVMQAAALALAAAAIFHHVRTTLSWVQRKQTSVAASPNQLHADRLRGSLVNAALAQIQARVPQSGTLLVLPEGVMLNFLAGRRSPTEFVNFMPPELAFFGQDRLLEALRERPADLVALVHKDTSEYGFPMFGRDYGQEIMTYIRATYVPVATLGNEPLVVANRFGIQLLEKRR